MKLSKKMIMAMRRTVAAYEKLIATGDTSKWQKYAAYDSCYSCHLCKATTTDPDDLDFDPDCNKCPLGPDSGCSTGSGYSTMTCLICAICDKRDGNYDNKGSMTRRIKAAAKRRLSWLLKKFNKASPGWQK